ncbi:AfsR/SARP family transcriptional regulator [Actinoallomurus iriomotensis]|uniref:SARP family transcriptional regulator n=1 Tax=Actinoallomurus iriomotensis TaxID=478107 RepID=A0A9W6RVC0_9ACTN|nr:BTAD domain-containing putative transcriptional regulator [Actinoallomurus iriomotensis]GLY80575.1 SARP family transcriptional regulator [Actinoallomurus iriomotensis]
MKAPMRFVILGPVELRSGGTQHNIGTAKERCLLSIFLLNPGQVIPAQVLIDCIWGNDQHQRARDNLYTYLSRLRHRLQMISDDVVLTTSRTSGYSLQVEPETVDYHRFKLLQRQARAMTDSGEDEYALQLLREAASLRMGEPLANLSGDWAERTRAKINDELLGATLERIEIELRLGSHTELISELHSLVQAHPLHERLIGHLLVALYRSGRQAEALEVYHQATHRMNEEYGTDITAELRELHERILHGDRSLLATPRSQPTDLRPRSSLPFDLRFVVGRRADIEELSAAVLSSSGSDTDTARPATVLAIDGMPGVGKTALSIHLAHLLASQYPDGQFFLDLRTYDDARRPALDASAALDRLLRMLGVSHRRIPASVDDRAELWRTELSGRRVLLVLDDAASHEQVRPLLPGALGCLAIVTSRHRLAGLDDVRSRSLDVLSPADAASLFTHIVGPGRSMNDHDVDAIVRICGHLPMAIQLVANRFRHRPAWSIADLARRLAQDNQRLAEIRAENREITAAFEGSFRELEPDLQTAFRLLGLHPGPHLTPDIAAAAISADRISAERLLEDLQDRHLIEETITGHFQFHNLIRDYARHLAERDETEANRQVAIQRIIDYFLHTAEHADRILYPHRHRIDTETNVPKSALLPRNSDDAREWLESELPNLLAVTNHAAAHGWTTHAAQLSSALAERLESGGHWEIAISLHEQAVAVWREKEDQEKTAEALADLSLVQFRRGEYLAAAECASESLETYRSLGNRRREAAICDHLSLIHWQQARLEHAIAYSQRALTIYCSLSDQQGQARCLDHTAIFLDHLGRYRDAIETRRKALAIYSTIGDLYGRRMALNNMGHLQIILGQVDSALECFQQAASGPELGRQHEAIWQNNMADVYRLTERYDEALAGYRAALHAFRDIGDRRSESETLIGIASTFVAMGQLDEALAHAERGIAIAQEIGERHEETRALRCAGEVLLRSGRHTAAMAYLRRSLRLADALKVPFERAMGHEDMGYACLGAGEKNEARKHWKHALRIFRRLDLPDTQRIRAYLSSMDKPIQR